MISIANLPLILSIVITVTRLIFKMQTELGSMIKKLKLERGLRFAGDNSNAN